MKKRSMLLTAGASAALMFLAVGCGNSSSGGGNTSQTASAGKPQKGGTLVYALPPQTNITWYLPYSNGANASLYNQQLIIQMYTPLVMIGNDYGVDYKDSLAKSITYNKAGTVYTVKLHDNYKWSDGKPVTAKDVVWGYDILKATDAKNAPAPWPNFTAGTGGVPDNVKSVVATDNDTVTITLNKPANQEWFIYNGIGLIYALPQHAWNKYPNDMKKEVAYLGKEATNPSFFKVFDGPFKLQSAKSNQSWTMVPNPDFGGHKSTLDKLVFSYQGSNDSEFAALKTGAVNLGYLDLAQYGSKQALTSAGDTITPIYPFGFFDIELNLQPKAPLSKAFNDIKVRQALEMGVDQDTINKSIYHGYAEPQYSAVPPQPKTKFLDPALNKPIYPYNLNKAKKLLESDGWQMKNGVMTKDGQQLKFTLLYSSGSESVNQMYELIQQDWKKIGVDVTLKPEPFASLIGTIDDSSKAADWAAAGGQGVNWGGSYPSGDGVFQPGGLDNFGYNDAKENQLIKKTTEPAASAAATMKAYDEYSDYTAKNLPVLWSNNVATLSVSGPKVHNAIPQYLNLSVGYPLLQYIWISK